VKRVFVTDVKGHYVPLKAAEVIAALSKVDPNTEVLMYSDEEGNQINKVLFVEVGKKSVTLVPYEC